MGEMTDTRLRECIACWRCSKPVPDFEFAEALRMATELQELRKQRAKLEAERDEAVEVLRVYPRRHRDVAPEWADRVEALLARYDEPSGEKPKVWLCPQCRGKGSVPADITSDRRVRCGACEGTGIEMGVRGRE